MSTKYSRGDIWFVQLDTVIGREQAKKRPCLILSANNFNQNRSELAIVVPLTSKNKHMRIHLPIYSPEGGLIVPSFIMCEQIRSVSAERFSGSAIGRVDSGTLKVAEQIIKILLDFA